MTTPLTMFIVVWDLFVDNILQKPINGFTVKPYSLRKTLDQVNSTHKRATPGRDRSTVGASRARGFPKSEPMETNPCLLKRKSRRLRSEIHTGTMVDSSSNLKLGLHLKVRMGKLSKY